MKFTPLIKKALGTAARLHNGQKRKGSNTPFIVHPIGVAIIVSNYTENEDVIAASLLHDVLEDVPGYGFDALKQDFGENIALLVKDVSEDKDPNVETDAKATWEERKKKYLAHLQIAPEGALLISAADKINNLYSLQDTYKELGKAAFDHFNAPPTKILWYYEEVIKILKEHLNSPIVDELKMLFGEIEKEIYLLTFSSTDLKDIYLGAVETKGGWDVKVYIINTSDEPKTLQLLQGSFQGDTDGLMDLGHSSYKKIVIPAKSSLEIDHMDDAGELDFTTYYNIKDGDTEYVEQISGRSFPEEKMVDIPILNQKGYFSGFGKVGKPA